MDATDTPLSQLHQRYQDHLEASGKANATVMAYTKDVEQLIKFLNEHDVQDPNDVIDENIEDFKDDLKKRRYTNKTISRKVNSIKSFFRFLDDEGVIDDNPAEIVAHPKFEQKPPRILTRLEYRALRDACKSDTRMYAIVELLLQTGMRISELANLQLDDVDFDREVIQIQAQKSRGERKVPLNDAAKDALKKYLSVRPRARERTVFLTKTCRPFLVRNIRTSLNRYFDLAGIDDAKVNDLRHTFIVEQLKAGTPLVYVSQLVGHKRITTTEKYLDMVEVQDMDPQVKIEQL